MFTRELSTVVESGNTMRRINDLFVPAMDTLITGVPPRSSESYLICCREPMSDSLARRGVLGI